MRLVLFYRMFNAVSEEAGAMEAEPRDPKLGGGCGGPRIEHVGDDTVRPEFVEELLEVGLEHEKGLEYL